MSGSAKDYGTERRQKELLTLIKSIDNLFEKEKIRYSLSDGSLIGAIRHNGFIPWDDDIDIMLDRENYDRACALLTGSGNNSALGIRREIWVNRIHPKDSTDPDDAAVDMFVIDHCPDSMPVRRIKALLIKALQGMMKIDNSKKQLSLFYRICVKVTGLMGRLFSQERKYKWYQAVSQIGNKKKTKYVSCYNNVFEVIDMVFNASLMEHVESHPFEDTLLPVTSEFDHYLTTVYGNYMQLPPEDQRVPQHSL